MPMVMICCSVNTMEIKTAGDHWRGRDEARARLSSPPLYTSRECSVMKVRTSDDGNFGRRARFRRATREDGDGGARRGRMTTGARAGAKPFGFAPIARGGRGRASRARERRGDARAVSIGSNETFRWIRAMHAREGRGWGRWMSRDAMDERDD